MWISFIPFAGLWLKATIEWWSQQELNLYLIVRSDLFYPFELWDHDEHRKNSFNSPLPNKHKLVGLFNYIKRENDYFHKKENQLETLTSEI
jgi:hypothetical protein